MPNSCLNCGHTKGKDKKVSMFRFPSQPSKKETWLRILNLTKDDLREHTCICSRHFIHGDPFNPPSLNIGKKFLSPKKTFEDCGKRALKRSSISQLPLSKSKRSATISSSPIDGATLCSSTTDDDQRSLLTSSVGEPLLSDYSVHELPGYEDTCDSLVNTACTTRIEFLENESRYLNSLLLSKKADLFRIDQICRNDSLVGFYTGFASYEILLLFVEFLGPAIHNLKYWGESERKTSR